MVLSGHVSKALKRPVTWLSILGLILCAPCQLYLLNSALGAGKASYAVPLYIVNNIVTCIVLSALLFQVRRVCAIAAAAAAAAWMRRMGSRVGLEEGMGRGHGSRRASWVAPVAGGLFARLRARRGRRASSSSHTDCRRPQPRGMPAPSHSRQEFGCQTPERTTVFFCALSIVVLSVVILSSRQEARRQPLTELGDSLTSPVNGLTPSPRQSLRGTLRGSFGSGEAIGGVGLAQPLILVKDSNCVRDARELLRRLILSVFECVPASEFCLYPTRRHSELEDPAVPEPQ